MTPSARLLGLALAGAASLSPSLARHGAEMRPAGNVASEAGAPMVGGRPMLPTRDIVDNAVRSAAHTTLVAAVKAAGLVDTLKGKGPFTVFAPVNDAFENLPMGTVETLFRPDKRAELVAVLTYHVVPGRIDAAELQRRIRAGGGEATLTTVQGGTLRARMNGERNVVIADASGRVAQVSTYDVTQSNGVIHVLDTVLLP